MAMDLPKPQKVVNGYLWDEFKKLDPMLEEKYGTVVPIFPLSDANTGDSQWSNKSYFIFNRAFRVQHGFYAIKRDTFIYSLRATLEDMIDWSSAIQKVLDRQDDAAKDANDWNLENANVPVYFHSFRVHQNEQADPRDFSLKPLYTTNFMVNVEYHLL